MVVVVSQPALAKTTLVHPIVQVIRTIVQHIVMRTRLAHEKMNVVVVAVASQLVHARMILAQVTALETPIIALVTVTHTKLVHVKINVVMAVDQKLHAPVKMIPARLIVQGTLTTALHIVMQR
jgi:hypothetical protein